MDGKDPTTYSLITYVWVIGLSCAGGLVSFLQRVKGKRLRWVMMRDLMIDLVTSGFAGLLTFLLCEAAGFDALWSAVLVGVSGHMGARAILRVERVLLRRFGSGE